MERKISRRKLLRRKYKRYAAAVAGAAILSGAALPGVAVAKSLAPENTAPARPATPAAQTLPVDKNTQKPLKQFVKEEIGSAQGNRSGAVHKYEWNKYFPRHRPDSDRYYDNDRYVYRADGVTVRYLNSPVDTIKAHAANYGFNAARDSFAFLSLSSRNAVVQVTKYATGERFKVTLKRTYYRDWVIVSVRSLP